MTVYDHGLVLWHRDSQEWYRLQRPAWIKPDEGSATIRTESGFKLVAPSEVSKPGAEKLTIWPDNEARIGICTNQKTTAQGRELPEFLIHEVVDDGCERMLFEELPAGESAPVEENAADVIGLERLRELYQAHGDDDRVREISELIEHLGNPSSQKLNKPSRAKRGSGGMTALGRRMVQSAAHIIERDAPKGCVSFITITMPALDDRQHDIFCRGWSEITRRIVQEISRELQRAGLSGDYVHVTENQPDRSQREGRFCPHLHLVCQGRERYESWALTPAKLTLITERVFEAVLGERVDCKSSSSIEKVEKSVTAYMAKYLTKEKSKSPIDEEHIPSAWWGSSKGLKGKVSDEKIVRFGGIAKKIFSNPKPYQDAGIITYHSYVFCEFEGVKKCVGMALRFNGRKAIQEIIKME